MIGARGMRVGGIKGILFERSGGEGREMVLWSSGLCARLGMAWPESVERWELLQEYEAATVFQQLSRDGWRREGHW